MKREKNKVNLSRTISLCSARIQRRSSSLATSPFEQLVRQYGQIWPCALDTRVSMRHKRCPPHSLQYDGVLATACQRKRWWEWRKRRGKINFLFGHSIRNRLIINRRLIHYWFRVKTLTKFPNWRESAVQSLQVAIKLLHRNPQTALSQCCQYTVLTV